MLYDVTILRKNGRRLAPAEREPAMRGRLKIVEMDRQANNFRRNVMKAELWAFYGETRMRGLGALFDPVLLPYNGLGLLMAGFDLSSGEHEISEHRQVWLLRPPAGTEAEWERSLYTRVKNGNE